MVGFQALKEAISILQDWLISHHLDLYPNRKEKRQLADSTGLSVLQVSGWFNRTRSRQMQRQDLVEDVGTASLPDMSKSKLPTSTNEDAAKVNRNSLRNPSKMIPSSENSCGGFRDAAGGRDVANNASPMQRFLSTPPEADPAPLKATKRAAATTLWDNSERSSKRRHFVSEPNSTPSSSSFEIRSIRYNAPHTDKGYDSISLSNMSMSSSVASQDSTTSHASWSGRQGRKRHRVSVNKAREHHHPQRRFACSWCQKAFKRAYEWQRHEESQHVPQTEFVCLKSIPEGKCAFCSYGASFNDPVDQQNLRRHYVNVHNAESCFSKPSERKAFDRKDHLIQHIRQVHNLNIFGLQINFFRVLDDWQRPIRNSVSEYGWTCGFCHENFRVWIERISHVKSYSCQGSIFNTGHLTRMH